MKRSTPMRMNVTCVATSKRNFFLFFFAGLPLCLPLLVEKASEILPSAHLSFPTGAVRCRLVGSTRRAGFLPSGLERCQLRALIIELIYIYRSSLVVMLENGVEV